MTTEECRTGQCSQHTSLVTVYISKQRHNPGFESPYAFHGILFRKIAYVRKITIVVFIRSVRATQNDSTRTIISERGCETNMETSEHEWTILFSRVAVRIEEESPGQML